MPKSATEAERLKALHDLDVLDSLPEDEFDGLVKAAAAVCDVPISSLVLVDAERNWFKAQVGLGALREIPREDGFCAHALLGEDLLEVPDATCDPRFSGSPLVTGNGDIRFYAGAPIRLANGQQVGTVCVLDRTPRTLSPRQREGLQGLAAAAGKALERRKTLRTHHQLATSLAEALAALEASKNHLRHLYEATPAMLHAIDAQGRVTIVSDAWLAKLGYAREDVLGRHASEFYTAESRERARLVGLPAFFRDGQCKDVPYQMVAKDGRTIDILLSAYMGEGEWGAAAGFAILTDVTAQKAAEAQLAQSEARYRGLVEDQSEMISLSTPDGNLTFVNHAYARQFGKTPQEMVGQNLFDLMPASAHAAVAERFAHARSTGAPMAVENQIILPDGRTRWFAWTNRALHDDAGRVLIHSVGRDVEEREANARRLRNSEARFRLLSESAPLGVFSATRRGACTYSNAQWREIFGHEATPGRREAWFAHVHPDDRRGVAARWSVAARQGDELFLGFRLLRSGAVRHVEVRARPKRGDNGRVQGFIGTAEDVTERTAILHALASSKDNLRRLYESTPAMLHSIDPEGRLLMVSDLWLSKLGYRREEVIGRRSIEFMTPESRAKAVHEVQSFFQRGWTDSIGYQMVARDGTIIDVLMSARLERDPEGKLVRSLTVIEDITARLRVERALRDSEARYRHLADATNDVITQLDLDLVRRYISPACRRVLGYEPDEMLGVTPAMTIHPEDAADVHAAMTRLAEGKVPGDRLMVTNRMRHKLGHWIWLEGGLNLVRDPESGAALHIICALRDVSERHRISEELERAWVAAERAAQSKTEFVANMSHELRTPLTGILGLHELLQQAPDLAPRHREQLALAHEAGRSLMAIINDVLDFSKIEAGQLAIEAVSFDPRALVDACCAFVREDAAKKNLTVETRMEGLDGLLTGDPGRLRQILLNLMTNAVKFTSAGGVSVSAVFDAASRRLRLSVSDTGIGIPANQLARVFERFRQADGSITRRYGGTGLGLAICRRLAELMGGTIKATSTERVGSTFTVEIPAPVADGAPTEGAQPDATLSEPRAILLAEDNPLNQTIIAEMLRNRGHRVAVVGNGAEAIAAAAAPARIDVILMDIQMPGLDGFSATRAIRDRQAATKAPRIPIIGLTASTTDQDKVMCEEAGMDAHITKPIEWRHLFAKIDELTGAPPAAAANDADLQPPEAVFDAATAEALAEIIGSQRLAEMLRKFVVHVEQQAVLLDNLPEDDVTRCAHGWVSMAGHLGFFELQHHAAIVEQDVRRGRGLTGLAALQAAAGRAIAAARLRELAPAA